MLFKRKIYIADFNSTTMKLSLEERTDLQKLFERANGLFAEVVNINSPVTLQQTRKYIEFRQVLGEIHKICPLVSETYSLLYEVTTHKKFLR